MMKIVARYFIPGILILIVTSVLITYVIVNKVHDQIKPGFKFTSSGVRSDNLINDAEKWVITLNNAQNISQKGVFNRNGSLVSPQKEYGSIKTDKLLNRETNKSKQSPHKVKNDSSSVNIQSMYDYCNFPTQDTTGQEGYVPRGYKLEAAAIIFRHGDRSSLNSLRNQRNFQLNCEFDQSKVEKHLKFSRFIRTLKRYQGKQHPSGNFQNWALYPNQRVCIPSQLTGNGALQHLKLGEHLSNVYVKKWQLLTTYSPQRLQVKCTTYTRTYQSVVAFLYGFLPQFNLTELNIQAAQTTFFYPESFPQSCFPLNNLKKDSDRFMASQYSNANTERNLLMNEIAQWLKLEKKQLPAAGSILDIFFSNLCHNLSLPLTDKNTESNHKSLIYKLWNNTQKERQFQNSYDESFAKLNKLASYPLLWDISQKFLQVMKGDLFSKIFVYSGHDMTLSPLKFSLGINDGIWPRYASRMIFELYSFDVKFGDKKYFVRTLFNGKDVTHKNKFCIFNKSGFCTMSSFNKFVFHDSLMSVGVENYHSVCQRGYIN